MTVNNRAAVVRELETALRAVKSGFMFQWQDGSTARLLDFDGEILVPVPGDVAGLLASLPPDVGGRLLEFAGGAAMNARERGFRNGERAGLGRLHEALGINKLVEALNQLGPS